MDAEQIVGFLAAFNPLQTGLLPDDRVCKFCGVWSAPKTGHHPDLTDPAEHDTECPWRLATEWVAATDESVILASASAPLLEDEPPTS